jgi:hypothetical protein
MVNEFFLIQLKTFSTQLEQLQEQVVMRLFVASCYLVLTEPRHVLHMQSPDLNRAERGTLRRLGEELYRGLRILENYRILNWTGA